MLFSKKAINQVHISKFVSFFTSKMSTFSPFHLAVPVNNLEKSRHFYGSILGLEEGRSSSTWIDYNMGGNQLVVHFAGEKYLGSDYINGVDKDMVPVPHFGLCLTVDEFKALAQRLQDAKIKFIIEPHIRFEGKPGEQWTMFFKDPSNNSLEFKAMSNPKNLFAKYYVDE